MQSSTLAARSVSTTMYAVSTGCSCNVASVTIPVRPMPPAVAQNASWCGSSVSTPRSGVASASRVTASAKDPCRNLPWMSEAIAPPTVTWRVPGTTRGNHPSGRNTRMSISMLTPASTVQVPLVGVEVEDAVELRAAHDVAAAVLGRVAVAPAEPPRHDAARIGAALVARPPRRCGARRSCGSVPTPAHASARYGPSR